MLMAVSISSLAKSLEGPIPVKRKSVLVCNSFERSIRSCEGHPYRVIPDNNQRKYKNTAYFEGGYLQFCSIEDKKVVLAKLKEKSDYFSEDTHSKIPGIMSSLYWEPIRSAEVDGHKYSVMRYETLTKIFKVIYQDIWKTLLEVAQELPYKETDDPWILKAEILDKPLKPHFANVQGLKTFEEV